MATQKTTEERLRDILADQFDADLNTITPATRIGEDLGADSIDAVEIAMAVEDEFQIAIPDEDIESLGGTVEEVCAYIDKKLAE